MKIFTICEKYKKQINIVNKFIAGSWA